MSEAQKFIALTVPQIDMALHSIKRRPATATFWGQGENQRLHCKIISYQKVQDTFFIRLEPEKEILSLIEELEEKNCPFFLFNAQLPGDNLFFKANHRRLKKGEVHFRIAEEVFKVQRRQHPRLPTENMNITVQMTLAEELPSQPFPRIVTGEMLDLSSGGMAVKALSADFENIEVGKSLKEISFQLRKQIISCQAQLRFKMSFKYQNQENRASVKLGFLFENLKSVDKELIDGFVFENSSKFFGRL